jgi:23S rRNA (adenine1618-N6)-methyltransferase
MPSPSQPKPPEKEKLHARNKHNQRYNFPQLIKSMPALKPYVSLNAHQDQSIDFKNPEAVKMLNKALLNYFYKIKVWDIPAGYLCPPIPGRADYVHYLADLLAQDYNDTIPQGKGIKVLDLGVGANCIYPLIGNAEYGWTFVGTDIDTMAIGAAKKIIDDNGLSQAISLRRQSSKMLILNGVINRGERFHITMCNPPFHTSLAQAMAGSERKWKNLGHQTTISKLNFGGRNNELWYPGGEESFVRKMIVESVGFADSCLWFTSLISKKESLPGCYYELRKANAVEVRTIDMAQGQKVSRLLAWTFLDAEARQVWLNKSK